MSVPADKGWPDPVSLTGAVVGVEPMTHAHHDDLAEAAADGDLHTLWYTMVPKAEDVAAEIDARLAKEQAGTMRPFAIIDRRDGPLNGRAVGMTTYMNIEPAHRRLEIGSTWYRKAVQRSALNTECKFLLLRHAFEDLDCIAVDFRTHRLNWQSRNAIERLGAKLDGILRNHMIMANGTVRDTATYSILANEWPSVKANLTWMMEKPRG